MVEDPLLISRAIVIWSGKGKRSLPVFDIALRIREFGANEAARLLPIVQDLKDYFALDEIHGVTDLHQMDQVATCEFRQRHSEITDEAVNALSWCFTFDNR